MFLQVLPMPKSLFFYLAVLLVFGTGIYFILDFGSRLKPDAPVSSAAAAHPGSGPEVKRAPAGGIARTLIENVKSPLSILLLQVVVIVLAARLLGTLFHRIGQPP